MRNFTMSTKGMFGLPMNSTDNRCVGLLANVYAFLVACMDACVSAASVWACA